MPKELNDYLKEPYTRILIPSDGSYSAEMVEFPGCFAEGKTPDEAIRNLEEAAEAWIEASLEQGLKIPEPFMNQGFGGKIALRLPRSLHRQATMLAEREDVSLNQFLVSAISARIGAEDLYTRILDRFEQLMTRSITNITYTFMRLNFPQSISLPTSGLKIDKQLFNTIQASTLELAGD